MLYLFDIDGTLVKGDGVGRRAFERACLEVLGLAGSLSGIQLDGMTDPLILEQVFRTHLRRAPETHESETILGAYLRYLAPEVAASTLRVLDGVLEVLDRLEARSEAILGLATGNLREGARIKLEHGKLWHRFRLGGFGSDAAERAELVRVAIERAHAGLPRRLTREEIVVIGDTPRDVAAAHAAGATAIAVATGSYTLDQLRAAGADRAYPTLREWLAEL